MTKCFWLPAAQTEEGGTTLLGSTTLDAIGNAMYVNSALPAGANTLTLNYSGDTNDS